MHINGSGLLDIDTVFLMVINIEWYAGLFTCIEKLVCLLEAKAKQHYRLVHVNSWLYFDGQHKASVAGITREK